MEAVNAALNALRHSYSSAVGAGTSTTQRNIGEAADPELAKFRTSYTSATVFDRLPQGAL